MQHKIFKVKIFEVTRKSVKSVKVFSLEIFRLYGSQVAKYGTAQLQYKMRVSSTHVLLVSISLVCLGYSHV